MEKTKKIFEALELFEKKLCVLSTVDEKNNPQSSVVYYLFDENLNIYFMTGENNKKCQNLIKNPKVAFITYSLDPMKSIQIEGKAEIIKDEKESEEKISELLKIANKNSKIPPAKQIIDNKIIAIKIKPVWARLNDFDIYRENNTFMEVNFD